MDHEFPKYNSGKDSVNKNSDPALLEALIASEARYRRLFESAKDGILILDAESGMIIDVNPFLIDLLGYSKEDFLEKQIWEIGFLKDIVANREKYSELLEKEYVRYDNLPLETAQGNKISVEFVSNVYLVDDHKVIQCNIRDITRRRKAEEALVNSKNRMRTLIQTIPDLIWQKDINGIYLSCNPMFERFFGAQESDIVGKTDYDFVTKDLADSFRVNDRKAMMASHPVSNEEWVTFADDGHRAFLETIKAPVYDSENINIGVLGIGRDLTHRKAAEEELIVARTKAEESDRLKTAFLANMSHEIRTPMNGIMGFAELLKEPRFSIEEKNDFISIIEKSGVRMLNIINDIVSISKIESGRLEAYTTDTDINDLIENIYDFFKTQAEQKKLEFIVNKSVLLKNIIIRTDKEKLTAILTNLVNNAIKFTDSGSIEIGCSKVESNLEFYVKDTGVGVIMAQKELIFDRFRQGSEALDRNYEGTGLGLAISKAYVELLGGKIWLGNGSDKSISQASMMSKGSIFFFTIPFIPGETGKNAGKIKKTDVSELSIARNFTVLIVEDDKISGKLIEITLKTLGINILQVNSGMAAVDTVRNNSDIDLILMDIKLPDIDGYEATTQIRKFNNEVVIIAQTAYGINGDRDKALTTGCDEYLEKPINPESLRRIIKRHMIRQKTGASYLHHSGKIN